MPTWSSSWTLEKVTNHYHHRGKVIPLPCFLAGHELVQHQCPEEDKCYEYVEHETFPIHSEVFCEHLCKPSAVSSIGRVQKRRWNERLTHNLCWAVSQLSYRILQKSCGNGVTSVRCNIGLKTNGWRTVLMQKALNSCISRGYYG